MKKRKDLARSKQRSKHIDIGEWLRIGQKGLAKTEEHISALYAITGHVLNKPTTWLLAHREYSLTKDAFAQMEGALSRLISGEPLAYILGRQEFYGRCFIVNEHVLIPRPETELLIENAIAVSAKFEKTVHIADVGTGSGCIAVTLAKEIENCQITAVDISAEALKIARANAAVYGVDTKIDFRQNDLLSGVRKKFNIICANLPYIPSETLEGLDVAKAEPITALDGGEDGFTFIQPLLADLERVLTPNGIAFFEIEARQGGQFFSIAQDLFPNASITIISDLARLPRLGKVELQR